MATSMQHAQRGGAQLAPDTGMFLNQTCLVAGGGGIVGKEICALILKEGGTVFAPVRTELSRDKLLHMLSGCPTQRLKIVVGDYSTKPGALNLVSFLNSNAAQRGLDHVVSIHGGRHERGTLQEVKGGDFLHTMESKTLPHIVVAQASLAHLNDRAESSYCIVTGGIGAKCLKADEALLCIANAASFGVAAALHAECAAKGVLARPKEMRLGCVVKRDEAHETPAFPGWSCCDASDVAAFWACNIANAPSSAGMGAGKEECTVHVTEQELRGCKNKLQSMGGMSGRMGMGMGQQAGMGTMGMGKEAGMGMGQQAGMGQQHMGMMGKESSLGQTGMGQQRVGGVTGMQDKPGLQSSYGVESKGTEPMEVTPGTPGKQSGHMVM